MRLRLLIPISIFHHEIQNKIHDPKYRAENKLLLDSLIGLGIQNYDLYNLRAKIYLDMDELDLALSDLQRAMVYSSDNQYGKSRVSFNFITYYTQKGQYEFAAKFLQKMLKEEYVLMSNEIILLMEDSMFTPLKKIM